MEAFGIVGVLAEGKTKKVFETNVSGLAILESNNNLSKDNGATIISVEDKGELANTTNSNTMGFLNECGLPTSFIRKIDNVRSLVHKCNMILYEVVVRGEAFGSYIKCYPHFPKNHVFPKLVVQFFLKTSGKRWNGMELPVDDPLIVIEDNKGLLYLPDRPIAGQEPFAIIDDFPLKDSPSTFLEIERLAIMAYLAFEKGIQQFPGDLRIIDCKFEFGIDQKGRLRIADVVDSDSWRVLDLNNEHYDKQTYRDGEDIEKVMNKYRIMAGLTGLLRLPTQQIIVWTGSEKDDTSPITQAICKYTPLRLGGCRVQYTTRSMHKQPVLGCYEITNLVHKIPDSVVIALIGMSNGAGPILSTQVTVPVITVPANYKGFPNDIWSSLRTPSNTPVMTTLSMENAALAALQILAMKNPMIYMQLRASQEKLLSNYLIL